MKQTNSPEIDEGAAAGVPQEQTIFSPDDALPPVEAPGAGFLLQLFVVPAVIVMVIVLVWLMFQWIARGSDDPHQLIDKISLPTKSRFQAASQLANVLRGKGHENFKKDPDAAEKLARILRTEIEAGSTDESAVNLRMFICRALGKFRVENGMDVLLLAAQTQNDEEEIWVRRHAISAIAERAEHAASEDPPRVLDHPGLVPAMLELADDEEYMVREATAVAMSWLGHDELLDKLRQMLEDPYPNVRYNAAINCARLGDERAVGVLVEMLDPYNAGVMLEKPKDKKNEEKFQILKRQSILINALRAIELLEEANPMADLSVLAPALEALTKADVDPQIRIQATGALNRLRELSRQ